MISIYTKCNNAVIILIFLSAFFIFFQTPLGSVESYESEAGNFSIRLNEGWNLLSVPMWADEIRVTASDIEAWVTYRNGQWVSLNDQAALYNELNNPARAVYIKALRSTSVQFKWAELTPDRQFASQPLSPGWNLVSSSLRADYMTIMAGLLDGGGGGVTHIYAQNRYNSRKQAGYYLTWAQERNALTSSGQSSLYDMYPFDGYWVYLRGEATTFSTPVGGELPGQVNQ